MPDCVCGKAKVGSFLRSSIPPGLGNYCVSVVGRLLRVDTSLREMMQPLSCGNASLFFFYPC